MAKEVDPQLSLRSETVHDHVPTRTVHPVSHFLRPIHPACEDDSMGDLHVTLGGKPRTVLHV